MIKSSRKEVMSLNNKSKLKVRSSSELKHKIAMAGFTSKELAKTIGRTPTYVSSIINGNDYPGPGTARLIIEALNFRLGSSLVIGDIFFDTSVKKNATEILKQPS